VSSAAMALMAKCVTDELWTAAINLQQIPGQELIIPRQPAHHGRGRLLYIRNSN
jgi:hypothetical protein